MITTNIDISQTAQNDIVITTEDGFPAVYAGRGSYSGQMNIMSYHALDEKEEVQLIYVGRYTSIGDNISVYCDMNHDYRSVYMGVIPEYGDKREEASGREKKGQMISRMRRKGMTVIGNDVWIGNDVTLISDVVIGNGAVIGAGSVVAHDVEPYSIYCGNPAVKIADRFPADIAGGLQKISWWEYDREKLTGIESDMKGDVGAFVQKYAQQAGEIINKTKDKISLKEGGEKVFLTFVDIVSDHPAFCDIMIAFGTGNFNDETKLVVCYHTDDENESALKGLLTELAGKLKSRARIEILGISSGDDEIVISGADDLVLGRDTANVARISYAMKYGVRIMSGVNRPVF